MTDLIFHICRRDEWAAASASGGYVGSSQDGADGFIHFSTTIQLRSSASKHRAGQTDLILLTVDPEGLGKKLKWEPSRDGRLFPHLYGILPVSKVLRADPIDLGDDGVHLFPDHVVDV